MPYFGMAPHYGAKECMMLEVARTLTLTIPLGNAGRWNSESRAEGKIEHNYQWSQSQWRHIEMVAFRMVLAQMNGTTEWAVWADAIVPEALDFWEEDLPDGLFKTSDDLDEDEHLKGCATAIGVVDAILSQFEEEVGKRDGALP